MKIVEKIAKSIITPSKLPDADYVINPYIGCAFSCKYCYASFMGRFINKSIEGWGNYVYIKTNAVELAEKEVDKLIKKNANAKVLFSSVTDAWQGVEQKYKLSREILKIFVKKNFQGQISILTKSPLILRDIDLLKKLKNVRVGLTITSTDDKVSRFLETKAPNVLRRLDTLKKLNEEGVKTYAFIGPIFPHFINDIDNLDKIFKNIKEAGTNDIFVEHLNLSSSVLYRMKPFLLNECSQEVYNIYIKNSQSREHKEKLNIKIIEIINKYNMNLMLGKVIEHGK